MTNNPVWCLLLHLASLSTASHSPQNWDSACVSLLITVFKFTQCFLECVQSVPIVCGLIKCDICKLLNQLLCILLVVLTNILRVGCEICYDFSKTIDCNCYCIVLVTFQEFCQKFEGKIKTGTKFLTWHTTTEA